MDTTAGGPTMDRVGPQTDRTRRAHWGRAGYQHVGRGGRIVAVGIDVGSISSDVVVLAADGSILWKDYRRTEGRPVETVREQLGRALEVYEPGRIGLAAATGAAGRLVAELLGIPFVNEVPAQAAAIAALYPDLEQATLIEMGGQDSKLIFLERHQGRLKVRDFALNTVCAAGTGSFLDQQAKRLGVDIKEEFGRLALQSKTVPRLAGRCSVFAKSDMIHLQQQATPTCDIIAGLCVALARGLKSNLGCGRTFVKPIIFTGGVAANAGVVRAFETVLELKSGELIVPDEHFFTGAIGAVIVQQGRTAEMAGALDGTRSILAGQVETPEEVQCGQGTRLDVWRLDDYLGRRHLELADAPRRPPLPEPALAPPASRVYGELLDAADGPIDAYLGVDVGSISTNVVVMDTQRRVLAKEYLMTAGNPLRAVRQGLGSVASKVAGRVRICGAATTGSGRYLTGDFIGADVVINEITAQAAGAAIVDPQVDTIFEIGGQDSKYISLENGVVVDFEMNHACAAGTGSFLEEQAQRLGIRIDQEFAALAMASTAPIKLGERCTVFIESDLISYQQQGAAKEDLIAGLAYSIVANYLNRVVGRRKIGRHICFQGGTAFNKAVWAAFEQVVGKPIRVPDHHEVTGALGAASIVAEHMARRRAAGQEPASRFRGFENLAHIEYEVESFTCRHCSNNCEIKKVTLPGSEPLFYGSRCDRYNLVKKRRRTTGPGAFAFRERALLEYAGLAKRDGENGRGDAEDVAGTPAVSDAETGPVVGIPRALASWQMLPLFARFFRGLGCRVVVSEPTSKATIRQGVEAVAAQPCFPVKVAYGHVAELLDRGVDWLFIPAIRSMPRQFEANRHNHLCPYVQSFASQVRTAFARRLDRTQVLDTPLYLGEGRGLMRRGFERLGRRLGASRRRVRRALAEAVAAQEAFERALVAEGRRILSQLPDDGRMFVLVSRPYNGCDGGMNLDLPGKLAERGVPIMPMDMLDLSAAPLTDPHLHGRTYWVYGQKILRAAEIIRDDPRLFAVYLSNFSCGPDSFIQTFFKDLMQNKPVLLLELDEHSADAGLITRLEAFLESLKHYRPQGTSRAVAVDRPRSLRDRTLYIPYMGDASYGMAACFRGHGQDARVMPVAGETTLLEGRRFTTGKECLPCAIVIGEMMRIAQAPDFDPDRAAFFMPAAAGPCRFGMYNLLQRLVLRQNGLERVPMVSPNQDSHFYNEFCQTIESAGRTRFMKHVWTATVGVDLLVKVLLRLRPFVRDAGAIRRVYEQALRGWVALVERRGSLGELVAFMETTAERFAALERMDVDKPRVAVVGEIYVRNHPFANNNIIARLEALGAACELSSVAEWIYYTNFTRVAMARRRREIGPLLGNLTEGFIQRRIERALARPLEAQFGPLVEGPIQEVLHLAEPYLDPTFEGEAVLSIGKIVEAYHRGLDGAVNVMPFTCMPSTIVSTQTTRISAECDGMPILNLSFDGQEDAALTTRLEAFVDQIRQRRGMVRPVHV